MLTTSPDYLPDDAAALKALLLQRDTELLQLRATVSTLEHALSIRGLEIEQLQLQINKLKRMQFGRKSEKLDRKIEQLETRLEDLIAEEGQEQLQSSDEISGKADHTSTKKSARRPLPDHLIREEHVLEPVEQSCPQCGGELKPLGRRRVRTTGKNRSRLQSDPARAQKESLRLLRLHRASTRS